MFTASDHRMMLRAIELATLVRYTNHPNPRVGCVIAQGERVVGEGWHRKWGEPHAEAHALQAAGAAARGATAYVTLEPHSYQGRTPPCTDALIRAGIAKVICGALDPNLKVHGNGVRQLQSAGIEVQTGLLETEVRELNLGFERRMTSGRPRLVVKIAASLDGRIALANGKSQWITGEEARADVQRLRAEASAVLTGVDTVLADDPQLNVRDPSIDTLGRQPLRIVLDTRLRMPATARMLKLAGETLVFCGIEADVEADDSRRAGAADDSRRAGAADDLRRAGAQVIPVPVDASGHVSLESVLNELAQRQCNDVLVEAGPTLAGQILQRGLADEVIVYVAPVVLGPDAKPMANLPRLENLEDAARLALKRLDRIGADAKLVFRPVASLV